MKKVVFILGSGHCGSTLLDLMLDAHSEIAGVGEMHGLQSNSLCTCGTQASECPFWSVVAAEEMKENQQIYRSKLDFLVNGRSFRSVQSRKLINAEGTRDRILQMYDRIDSPVIVDSSKSVDRAELFSGSEKIEPLYIHLVRDGRAVTWSYIRKYKRWFPYFFKWAAENIKIWIFTHRTHAKTLFVRYEDIVTNPERELKRISDWMGLAYEPGMLDYRSGKRHQIGGNRMRFNTDSKITADTDWKNNMPLSLRFAFTIAFGWLNALYSYL